MPLGAGYSVEEQLTGAAEHGGLQIELFPLKAEFYHPPCRRPLFGDFANAELCCCCHDSPPDMGLAPGGRMKQEIYEDNQPLSHYDLDHRSRCFVHLCNSLVWREITRKNPPPTPATAKEYERAGLPWFDYYSERPAADGSATLAGLQSIAAMARRRAMSRCRATNRSRRKR